MTHEQQDTTSPTAAIRRLSDCARDPYELAREAVAWGIERGLIQRPSAAIDDQPEQPQPQQGTRRDPFRHMRMTPPPYEDSL